MLNPGASAIDKQATAAAATAAGQRGSRLKDVRGVLRFLFAAIRGRFAVAPLAVAVGA
jgi:hypothetical protein